jgi:hypothetical protein
MVLLLVAPLIALVLTLGVHHRRVANRWVSPYSGFRAAAAKVTRTGEDAFEVAGARLFQVR